MDFLIWLEFFITLIFTPFWVGLLVGLFLGIKIKKYKYSGNFQHYEWPSPESYKNKIPGL